MTSFAVTGANGYLGSRLVQRLRADGARVVEISRRPAPGRPDAVAYSLEEGGDLHGLSGVDVLVHAAYDFSVHTASAIRERNVEGSRRLFDAAARAGITRIVFISTMSAFAGCRSLYGLAKLQIEDDVRRRGGVVIRPGLVFGGSPLGGMLGALERAVLASRVLPVPSGGNQRLFLADEADVADVVGRAAEQPYEATAPIVEANSMPWTLADILRTLGQAHGRSPLVFPVPWPLVLVALKAVELTGLSLRLRSDSLVSLVNQDPSPSFAALERLGVVFRPFSPESVQRRPQG
jgi:nucleoside-diphosphate-sugar epimerase